MSVLAVRSLTKTYAQIRALDGVTFEVPEGAVGLLGPNGAGKSTLIKILLGFVAPDSGEARVLGVDARKAPVAVREKIGYMPENESFVPGISAVEFVRLAALLSGLPVRDAMQRTHMVLDYVQLREERYRPVETYSTGMKQKVKFAQALVHHPRLLLLDEPTSGLDPRGREEMLDLIRDVANGKGVSVLLSTHILPDVEAVCRRAVVLHRGRVIADGTIDELTASADGRYEIRLKGDAELFAKALRGRGCAPTLGEDGVVFVPADGGTDPILRAAADTGVQIRHLARTRGRLEDLFSRLVTS